MGLFREPVLRTDGFPSGTTSCQNQKVDTFPRFHIEKQTEHRMEETPLNSRGDKAYREINHFFA